MKPLSWILFNAYKCERGVIRRFVLNVVPRMEGGEYFSKTLRKIFAEYHKINVGMYSGGGCFNPTQIDKYTTIGRYCSVARIVRTMNRNHPMHLKSTNALFFNPCFGYVSDDLLEYTPLSIANDVWIGHNAIVMPHVKMIGDGAVIGAGAVIHKDVPAYAVVVGNPGRVVRYRFSKEVIEELLASRWWEKSIEELIVNIKDFKRPYGKEQFDPAC